MLSGQQFPVNVYIAGGLLAVLPDLDVLYAIMRGRETEGDHHQNLTHRPLIMVPLLSFMAYLVGGAIWGIVAMLFFIFHYLHYN